MRPLIICEEVLLVYINRSSGQCLDAAIAVNSKIIDVLYFDSILHIFYCHETYFIKKRHGNQSLAYL
jgi:hypothetical protein